MFKRNYRDDNHSKVWLGETLFIALDFLQVLVKLPMAAWGQVLVKLTMAGDRY